MLALFPGSIHKIYHLCVGPGSTQLRGFQGTPASGCLWRREGSQQGLAGQPAAPVQCEGGKRRHQLSSDHLPNISRQLPGHSRKPFCTEWQFPHSDRALCRDFTHGTSLDPYSPCWEILPSFYLRANRLRKIKRLSQGQSAGKLQMASRLPAPPTTLLSAPFIFGVHLCLAGRVSDLHFREERINARCN